MRCGWLVFGLVVLMGACGGDDTPAGWPVGDAGSLGDVAPEPSTGEPTPSAGCGPALVAQSQVTQSLTVNGVERRYRLSMPQTDPGVARPVILAFHGGGGSEEPFPQQGDFDELEAIVAYPLGELVPPNEGEWQLNTSDPKRQDIDFVGALLDELSATYCVDTSRIYATGYSLGSMFIYEVACHMNDRFAAVASFAGTMPVSPSACVMTDYLPVMHLHGDEDGIISYGHEWDWKAWDEVGTMMDIPQLMEFWGDQNGCEDVGWDTKASGLHVIYDECQDGVRVEHHRLDGHGHWWPDTINGVSTHQVIWDFFSGFSKP